MTADTTHTHHLPRPGDTIRVTGVRQIHVDWHDGRRLILVTTDPFEIVDPADWSQR